MNEQHQQALLKNHDLKNYMSAAYSNLDLLTRENPQLGSNEHIVSTMNILSCSFEKANEIHSLFGNFSEVPLSSFETTNVQAQLLQHARPFYKKMSGIYSLDITDIYTLLDTPKFRLENEYETMEAEENIVSNAFKAGATRVEIRHHMKEEFMVSTYADNGSGMTQNEIDMFMAARAGDGVRRGMGSRSIMRCVMNHKMPLTISSEKGKGTTIRLVVPYTA